MITPVQFSLFYKMHRRAMMRNFSAHIALQKNITPSERDNMSTLADQLVLFISKQANVKNIDELTSQLQLFLQLHMQQTTGPYLNVFRTTFEQATLRLLFDTAHPKTEQFFTFLSSYMVGLMNQYFASMEENKTAETQLDDRLKQVNNLLIAASGPDDLPQIIEKIKEVFRFKRCVFYMYIPWKNEFQGMMGEKLDVIQNIRGKLTADLPIFDRKKAVYLRDPAPYIDDALIERFHLSSLLFIPIADEQQLYGWLELDQVGRFFPYDTSQIEDLTTVGKWIGLMLGRKPVHQEQLYPVISLTEKEQSVLYLIAEGHSNKEIANLLFMSPFTVRDYVQKLLEKLDAKNRTHLIALAYQTGHLTYF